MSDTYIAMANHHFGDTTLTKVFVGGLAWETPTQQLRNYFEQFGHILEAVIINDKHTGKSKGYGFVTFRDPDSARKACADPKPMIYGRRANCNIASLGRPPPPPSSPRTNIIVQDGGKEVTVRETPAYNGVPAAPPSLMYSAAYSYPTYTADYGYPQMMSSNPQYYQQVYGQSYSSYYYGYSVRTPRATVFHYPTLMGGYYCTDYQTQHRSSSETTRAGVIITSGSANNQGKD